MNQESINNNELNQAYDVLGVAPGATEAEVKSAYRKAAKMHHPDLAEDKEEATRRMQEINIANDLIKESRNPDKAQQEAPPQAKPEGEQASTYEQEDGSAYQRTYNTGETGQYQTEQQSAHQPEYEFVRESYPPTGGFSETINFFHSEVFAGMEKMTNSYLDWMYSLNNLNRATSKYFRVREIRNPFVEDDVINATYKADGEEPSVLVREYVSEIIDQSNEQDPLKKYLNLVHLLTMLHEREDEIAQRMKTEILEEIKRLSREIIDQYIDQGMGDSIKALAVA